MKYKVLKEFVSPVTGSLMEPSDSIELINFDDDTNEKRYYQNLVNYGFIEEIKDEPWKPEYGEPYWFINDTAGIFRDDGCPLGQIDKQRISIGNCFQTKEQAEKAVAWLKAFKVLGDDTKGFKPDWEDFDQNKYYVDYKSHGKLCVDWDVDYCSHIIHFATEADAEESIKNHKKEWLAFLGVESE